MTTINNIYTQLLTLTPKMLSALINI